MPASNVSNTNTYKTKQPIKIDGKISSSKTAPVKVSELHASKTSGASVGKKLEKQQSSQALQKVEVRSNAGGGRGLYADPAPQCLDVTALASVEEMHEEGRRERGAGRVRNDVIHVAESPEERVEMDTYEESVSFGMRLKGLVHK